MKNVLILSRKGGVGKTLIADSLAFKCEEAGIPYNFIDMDGQGSSIHETSLRDDAVIQIIDVKGSLQDEMLKWIENADFVIVPTLLNSSEQKPLQSMIEILEPFKGKKPTLYVFNRWTRYNSTKEFISWFNQNYPDLKTAVISDTTAFNQACALGISIEEYQSSNIGCKQIDFIFSSVKYELNLKDKRTNIFLED